jgi:hypothetical protein
MRQSLTVIIEPQSADRCGVCPMVSAGMSEHHDYCRAFGVRLTFVGNENGSYIRIPACAEQAKDVKP